MLWFAVIGEGGGRNLGCRLRDGRPGRDSPLVATDATLRDVQLDLFNSNRWRGDVRRSVGVSEATSYSFLHIDCEAWRPTGLPGCRRARHSR